MGTRASDDVTALLGRWRAGDTAAGNALMAKVQSELRRIAAAYLRRERSGHTLQPTAVVNEAAHVSRVWTWSPSPAVPHDAAPTGR